MGYAGRGDRFAQAVWWGSVSDSRAPGSRGIARTPPSSMQRPAAHSASSKTQLEQGYLSGSLCRTADSYVDSGGGVPNRRRMNCSFVVSHLAIMAGLEFCGKAPGALSTTTAGISVWRLSLAGSQ
jgi:hypothetical protein